MAEVLALLCPYAIQGGPWPEFPTKHGIHPKRLEVEIWIVERERSVGRYVLFEIKRARRGELHEIVVLSAGQQGLHEYLQRRARRDDVVDARRQRHLSLLERREYIALAKGRGGGWIDARPYVLRKRFRLRQLWSRGNRQCPQRLEIYREAVVRG